MSVRRWLMIGWMMAGLEISTAGQTPPTQNQGGGGSDDNTFRTAPAVALTAIAGMETEVGIEDTAGSLPPIPGLLGGIGVSPVFLSEMERSNYLRGGLNVGATYDDNPLLLSSGESNTSETIFPNIMIDKTSTRMRWTLGYAGGLTVNQKFTAENQGSQKLNFDSQYRVSPHVNLRVAESFSVTSGVFDGGNGAEAIAAAGGPNASLITPLATQRLNNTTVETNYHFALNDLIGASGSFFYSHFSNIAGEAQLADTQTEVGSAFWLHQIFHGDWGGATYRFERITFNPGNGETLIHSLFAVNTFNPSKQFTLAVFVGPQYSENQGLFPGALQSAQTAEWSAAGGVEGGWKNQHTSVTAGYSRIISDGGGVLGSVRWQNVYGTFRRQLTSAWGGALTASYGTNQALTVPFTSSANSINLTSAGISLERNVRKSFGLRMGYTHDFQQQLGVPGVTSTSATQTLNASRNRVFVTLSYQWARPLGM